MSSRVFEAGRDKNRAEAYGYHCYFHERKGYPKGGRKTVGVGLSLLGFPDIVVMGQDEATGEWLVSLIKRHWERVGVCYGVLKGVITNHRDEDMPLEVIPLNIEREDIRELSLNAAFFYTDVNLGNNETESARFVQLCWPDDKGLLPTQEGYDQLYKPQPLIKVKPRELRLLEEGIDPNDKGRWRY
ncbi:DUF4262 domain-containing protein [Shewanella sp. A25]|nr:DUF4262 domain-containing protein [Shewanella shenzhenensis]